MSNPVSCQHHQINIPNCASNTSPPIKLPRTNLVGVGDEYNKICVLLYKALTSDDWEKAQSIFDISLELLSCSISENYETPLHIAVLVSQRKGKDLVEKLVSLMQRDDLELQNRNGETALFIAAVKGDVEMAKIMVKKNEALLTIPNSQGIMPLSIAALYGKHENMVEYLYETCEKMTPTSCRTHEKLDYVLLKCVEAELFDIALRIVKDHKELAANAEALRILARKPRLFLKKSFLIWGKRIQLSPTLPSGSLILRFWGIIRPEFIGPELELLRMIWSSILKLNKDEISDILRGPPNPNPNPNPNPDPPIEQLTTRSNNIEKCAAIRPLELAATAQKPTYSSQMLFVAAECGNENFLIELISEYPDLIWKVNCDNNQSIFHVAVTHRRGWIFNMLKLRAGCIKDSIVSLEDENGNNILHLAGERPKSVRLQHVPGVILQMQHELIWFKEVEAIVPRYFREKKNKDGLTPRQVFTKNHQDLVNKGEKWMKEVATQVMVVSTLIAAIACALPFSVPGGFHQEKGTPIFIHKKLFTLLIIFDALSLMFASHSLLYVMSILMSSYAESDFKKSLPIKLKGCLRSLYYSVATMMSTFVIAIFLLYQNNSSLGVPISVAVFACLAFYLLHHFAANDLQTPFRFPKFVAMRYNLNIDE